MTRYLRALMTRLRGLFGDRRADQELDDEIETHLRLLTERYVRQGMTEAEAAWAARRQFGNVTLLQEDHRDMRGIRFFETFIQDLRYGARTLLKTPGFTLIIVITLALGIGANAAIFSVVNAVLLRPYPYPDPDRLMLVWEAGRGAGNPAPGNFLDWQKQNTVFEQLSAITIVDFNLIGAGNPERVHGMRVSAEFFAMMGLRPQIGRDFLPDEDQPGHSNVVILSHQLWQRRFGGASNILNRTIILDDQSYTVIGVLPAHSGLRFKNRDLWMPIAFAPERAQQRNNRYLNVIGRLKPGVTLEQARSEMNAIADRLAKQYPDSNAGWKVQIIPLLEDSGSYLKPRLLLLLGAVAFVLLIACANVANLLLARAATRQKEIVIRTALGAGRWRIIRQLGAESLLLSMAGGIAGSAIAISGVKIMQARSMFDDYGPRVLDFSLDWRMLAFTIAVTLLMGLGVGIAPAWQASKPNLNEILKDAGRGSTEGRRRRLARNALVVFEVALALVLLAGAGLMIRSFIRMQQVDLGFNQNNTVTASVSLPRKKYPEKDQQLAFFRQLIERAASLPGVQAAGAACVVPFSEGYLGSFEEGMKASGQGFKIEGRFSDQAGGEHYTDYSAVSPDYFKAMGIPLLRGRFFTEHDAKGASRVAIINNTLAKKFFPDEDPIGKRIYLSNEPDIYREIVGIVGDVKRYSLTQEAQAQTYEPYLQQPFPLMTLVVRAAGDSTLLNETIRREVLNLDREQPIYEISTLDRLVSNVTADQRSLTLLLWSFAAAALTLAAVGLYGVMSYAVTQRTREIGIRMALGAQTGDVLKLVVGQGLILMLTGLTIGLVTAVGVTRLLSGLLFGVGTTDPLTFTAVALLLAFVAMLACWIPARRATKVDPLQALRHE